MEITPIGYILIPLGILLFFKRTELLFYVFLFFVPFSASAVVNIESITFGLQISYYFAILWIIRVIINRLIKNNLKLSLAQLRLLIPLIIFWTIVLVISLVSPVLFGQKILVHFPEDSWFFSPLEFRRSSITQLMYLTFMILITIIITVEVNSTEKIIRSLKIILFSTLFISLWGLFEALSYYVGLHYPFWLFNNNIGFSQGYAQTVGGFKRIGSVATEPSKFASYMLWIIPLYISYLVKKDYSLIGKKLLLLMVIFVLVLLLSTSTTAYVGFLFMIIITMLYFGDSKYILVSGYIKRDFQVLVRIILLISSIFIFIIFSLIIIFNIDVSSLAETIKSLSIEKSKNISGQERSEGFIKGIEILVQTWFLGVGWGNNRTFDLGTTLLSNTGIIGFTLFFLFMIQIILKLSLISKYKLYYQNQNISRGFLFSIITGLFAHFVADPDVVSLIMWVIVGLSISLISISKRSIGNETKDSN